MKKLLLLFLPLLLIGLWSSAQPGCPSVNAGPDVTVGCGNNCTTLTATVVPTGATTSYSVSSIPYAPPYPYNTGTPILVNIDDTWSGVIGLPFTFCFYNNSYNQIVAGSNGLITFDVSVAGGYCEWSYTDACPSPNLPLNSIFGPYHDIDPSVAGTMYSGILGNFPCRTYVVNWNQVAMFSCNNLIATHQIVLYESTNIIEVYMQNKPLCSSWNSGNAVVGIQNSSGTVGLAAPGRNTSAWTATNEAWRFTPNGVSSVTVNWYDGATLIGTGLSVQVCPNATTTYTAEAIYNTCSGTTVTVTDQVTVNYNANFSINVNPTSATICPGDNVSITASGPSNVTFTWTPGTGLNTTNGPTVVASPTTTTTYTVTGVDPTNCSMSVPVTITVSPNPTVTITPSATTVCPGQPVTLDASGATNYTWSGAGLTSTTGASVTANPTTTTTYYVTGSSGSCSGTSSVTINMNPALNVSISPPSSAICPGQSVQLTATGADTYAWSGAGLSATTGDTVLATPTANTTYYVTGTSSGCTGAASATISLNGTIPINITPSAPFICIGNSVDLTASGASTYSWSPPTGLSTTTGNATTATPLVTTTYTVVGQDSSGCQGTQYVTVTVSNGSAMTFNPANPVICRGESIQIEVFGGQAFQWSPPQGLSSTTGNVVTAAPFSTTTYTVLGDNLGCTGVATIQVEVKPSPDVNFVADKYEGCEDLLVTFYDQSDPPSISWQWNFGDGTTPNAFTNMPNPTHLYTESGSYDVSLLVTSVDGCQAMMNVPQMITVFKTPIAIFYPTPDQAWIYTPDISFTDMSIDASAWYWDFGEPNVLDNYSNLPSPSHSYSDTGTFYVTLAVESPDGCVDTMVKTIYIEPNIAIYIPSSFTPNGDGRNDYFVVKGEGIDESTYYIRIFERWGKEIYFSNDINQGWDGKRQGTDTGPSPSTYTYFITFYDIKGNYHEYFGIITLVK